MVSISHEGLRVDDITLPQGTQEVEVMLYVQREDMLHAQLPLCLLKINILKTI